MQRKEIGTLRVITDSKQVAEVGRVPPRKTLIYDEQNSDAGHQQPFLKKNSVQHNILDQQI